jgi:hypothetical protein
VFHLADSVRFIPVDLGTTGFASFQCDPGDTLSLLPVPGTVNLAQPGQFMNAMTFSDGLDSLDGAGLAEGLHEPTR